MSSAVFNPLSATVTTPAGSTGREPPGHVERHVEGSQVAVVDADDVRSGVQGLLQLGFVVDLDQHFQIERAGSSHQSWRPGPLGPGVEYSNAATISSTASAPAARASKSWYSVTMKSFRRIGTSTASRTASRCSSAVEERRLGQDRNPGCARRRIRRRDCRRIVPGAEAFRAMAIAACTRRSHEAPDRQRGLPGTNEPRA